MSRGLKPQIFVRFDAALKGRSSTVIVRASSIAAAANGFSGDHGQIMANDLGKNDLGKSDLEKEAAARASLRFVKDGQVVGLGTGSTAAFFIKLLGDEVKRGLRVRGIPTSVRSGELAASLGIPLTTLDECQEIAVTVDGADEVDPQLRLIKGGGGALLREKIVASATKQLVIVADGSKQVPVLGKFPLPVEVIKFAQALVAKGLRRWGRRCR